MEKTSNNRYDEIIRLIHHYDYLGTKNLPNGTRLIGHIPHVGIDAWLQTIYPTITEDKIIQMEEEMGMKIPDDYKKFLMECSNGLDIFLTSMIFHGYSDHLIDRENLLIDRRPFELVKYNTYFKPRYSTHEMLFIGCYDWDNHAIYMMPDNSLVCTDKEGRNPIRLKYSLSELLEIEFKRLSTLFDEKGRQINPKAPTLPDFNLYIDHTREPLACREIPKVSFLKRIKSEIERIYCMFRI